VDRCDRETGACVSRPCRSTALDCNLGEVCDRELAVCVEVEGFCEPCDPGVCPENLGCVRDGAGESWCQALDCSAGAECPYGTDCARMTSLGDVTVGFGCIGQCGLWP